MLIRKIQIVIYIQNHETYSMRSKLMNLFIIISYFVQILKLHWTIIERLNLEKNHNFGIKFNVIIIHQF